MENLIQIFNNAIGWSILHSLWQGASIYIILFGIYLIFYDMSSKTKYILAYIAQVIVFACFVFTFSKYIQYSSIPAGQSLISEQEELFLYIAYLQNTSWSIANLFPYIVSLYALGLIVQITLFIKSYSMLNRIKKTSQAIVPRQWQELLKSMMQKQNISSRIQLLVSDYVTSPITMGVFKPLIIFPAAYINKISLKDAEAILLHEVAHIRRYDYLFNLFLVSIETILFFNPFVWLISRHVKIEREQACDDFVTQSHMSPLEYSKTLLHVEILRQEQARHMAMALSGHNKYNLLHRIKRINNYIMETKYTAFKHQTIAISCTSLALLFIAWVNPQTEANKMNKNTISTSTFIEETTEVHSPHISTNRAQVLNFSTTIDTSKVHLPKKKQKELEKIAKRLETESKDLEKHFESAEWQEKIKNLEASAKDIEQQFNTPEWREKIAKIERDALNISEKFHTPEWKERIAAIEKNALEVQKHFESPQWKERVKHLEAHAKKMEEHFNSAEWQAHISKIEQNAQKIEKIVNSPEWKQNIQEFADKTARFTTDQLKRVSDKQRVEADKLRNHNN